MNVTLGVDPTVRSGADRAGRALLFTPTPVQPGSTVSHWDTIAFPNQLMEPAINNDLTHNVDTPQDLTRAQLRDVGWFPDADLDGVADDAGDACLGSDLRSTVIVDQENTGVPNAFFTNGCSISDLIAKCKAVASNHGAYTSCVARALPWAYGTQRARAFSPDGSLLAEGDHTGAVRVWPWRRLLLGG